MIETLDDILNEIADKTSIYGACRSEDPRGCHETSVTCCRVGFFMAYEDRIEKAVEAKRTAQINQVITNHKTKLETVEHLLSLESDDSQRQKMESVARFLTAFITDLETIFT